MRTVGLWMLAAVAWAQPPLEGVWQGSLNAGPTTVRLVLHVAKNPEGGLTATVDSPDQGAKDLPVSGIWETNGQVKFTMAMLNASFEGARSADGAQIAGTWKQGPASLPLVLKKLDKAPDFSKPQDPKTPYPYDEQEVTFENRKAGITLAGTLTTPRGKGPWPVAVLITGSGPQDRDEAIMGHRPFLVLADHLTRKGIAVLRYDDRGVGKSTGDFVSATTNEFADDAEAAVTWLTSQARIDGKKIGLIGHSEGGLIAPMVAARSADVAFVVMLAGPGVPGEQVMYEQAAMVIRAGGGTEAGVAANRAVQEKMFAVIKKESDPVVRETKLRETVGGAAGAAIEGQVRMAKSAWFRNFTTYDPAPALARVKCPLLALNGEKDTQVSPSQNLPVIERILKAAGNKDYTVKMLPGLNHLFQTAKTGAPAEYAKIEETIAPLALETVSGWLAARAGSRSSGN